MSLCVRETPFFPFCDSRRINAFSGGIRKIGYGNSPEVEKHIVHHHIPRPTLTDFKKR
jgi:hypothetical protein